MLQKEMTLREYQEKAMATCMPSCRNISYMLLNLVGEIGELASKLAKGVRKEELSIVDNHLITGRYIGTEEFREIEIGIKLEARDIAWQLAGLCTTMGWDFQEICKMNLDKLASRKTRNVIEGNGDYR